MRGSLAKPSGVACEADRGAAPKPRDTQGYPMEEWGLMWALVPAVLHK